MTTVIQANQLSLHDVKEKFNLQQVNNEQFFWEWQNDLSEINEAEKQWLNRVKADFLSLEEYSCHEEIVKLAVLAPLLSLAGFFRYPFHADAEIQITDEDEGEIVRGKIDVLILRQQVWVTVVESKNKQFSLIKALPQALFYMTGTPNQKKPVFGLVTNGSHFTFIKLVLDNTPRYALSDEFSLKRKENELYKVLSILRRLGEL